MSDIPAGGKRLPEGRFLDSEKLISLLLATGDPLPSIPAGCKENVYFIVENRKNVERRRQGRASVFCDDCGAWDEKGSSPKCFFLKRADGRLLTVFDRRAHGKGYCVQKKKQNVISLVSLDPQPDPDDVIAVHRYYTKLKGCSSYKRRVTWLEDSDISENCCVEYVGSYPGSRPHGRRLRDAEPYRRRSPETIQKEKRNNRPKRQTLILETPPNLDSNPGQGKDTLAAANTETIQNQAGTSSGLPLITATASFQDSSAIQTANITDDGVAQIIVYTEGEMVDFEKFCNDPGASTAEKSLNLDSGHLMSTVYSHLDIPQTGMTDHSEFLDHQTGLLMSVESGDMASDASIKSLAVSYGSDTTKTGKEVC